MLQAQDDIVTEMKESAGVGLLRVTKDANAYKKVLKGLIVQVNRLTGCKFLSFFASITLLYNINTVWTRDSE